MLGTTKHCYILNIQAMGRMVSEKNIFEVFPIMSMGANDPLGMASLDPRGLVGRIYVGDH